MFKLRLSLLALFGLLLLPVRTACADTPVAPIETEKKATAFEDDARRERARKKARSEVGKALAELRYFTETEPDVQARHYIYLSSAGWCPPCNAEMPHVVARYAGMRKAHVELILVSTDPDEELLHKFITKHGVEFPVVMKTEAMSLPGYHPPKGIPSAVIVDAEGNVLKSGHGAIIHDWHKITGNKKQKVKKIKKKKRGRPNEFGEYDED